MNIIDYLRVLCVLKKGVTDFVSADILSLNSSDEYFDSNDQMIRA
jgi:hypothetical protein